MGKNTASSSLPSLGRTLSSITLLLVASVVGCTGGCSYFTPLEDSPSPDIMRGVERSTLRASGSKGGKAWATCLPHVVERLGKGGGECVLHRWRCGGGRRGA